MDRHPSAFTANPFLTISGSGCIGAGLSRVSRMRREYCFAIACEMEPIMTRIARLRTIAHTATSWNRVDLPAPGGTFRTTNSFSGFSSRSTSVSAASTCHGDGTRPK